MTTEKKQGRIENLFNSALAKGETVIWKGTPSKISLLAAPHGNMIILRWAVCFVLIVFMFWFTLLSNQTPVTSSTTGFLVIFIIALLYICVRPLIDAFTIQNKIAYCITDERVIIAQLSSSAKLKYIDYKDVTEFEIDMLTPVCGNIYIGKKAANSLRRSRSDTLTFNGEPLERPLVLYNVENPYDVATNFRH